MTRASRQILLHRLRLEGGEVGGSLGLLDVVHRRVQGAGHQWRGGGAELPPPGGGGRSPRGGRSRSSTSNRPCTRMASAAAGMAPWRIIALSLRLSPMLMGCPSPPAPMNAASVAAPTLMTAEVFTPARMVGDASGSRTRHSC